MRILVVTNLYPTARSPGFGSFVASRVEAFRRLGVDVEVIAITDPRTHRRLATKYASLAFRAAVAAARSRIGGRRFQAVETHIAFPTGIVGAAAARIAGAPLILFAHGADVLDIPHRSPQHRAAARWTYRRSRLVIPNSRYLAGALAELVPDIKPRIVIESPGLELDRFRLSANADSRSERAGILFVGRLVRNKGLDVLIEAMAGLDPRSRPGLTAIGDGPERHALVQLARSRGVDMVWRHEATRDEVAAAMHRAQVVVVPSRVEPLGLVLLEAMAAGALVVATAAGGLRETVEDGRNGWLVEPDDPAGLAVAIRSALAATDDPARVRAMRAAAAATATSHDAERVARRAVERYAMLNG